MKSVDDVIHQSRYPEPLIPDTTLPEYVLADAAARGDHPALIDGITGQTLSYGELARRVPIVAARLASDGLHAGDVVAMISPNQPAWAIAFFAVTTARAVVTAMNPQLTSREITDHLRASGAVLVIADVRATAARDAATVVGVRVLDITTLSMLDDSEDLHDTTEAEATESEAESVAVLAFSSGTTGLPKGVLLTHHNLVSSLCQHDGIYPMTSDDVVLAVLPFFHIFGMSVVLSYGLRHGATIVTLPRFDLETYLTTIATRRVTWLHLAPPLAHLLSNVDRNTDLSSVKYAMSGAAPLDAATVTRLQERLGCAVGQGYGMTEASPGVTWVPNDATGPPAGSVGYLLPGTHARIVDPGSGHDTDGPGELWIRGPQVMRGYLNDQEVTNATIDHDGWMRTGDIVRIDSAGVVWVVDRLKELIKYKGYQIAPAELEALLRDHPLIDDAAVVGAPDPVAGEIPHAFVVRTDERLTEADVLAWCGDRVAPYKKPRIITFVDVIPRSATGKVLRRELRAI